MLMRETVVVSAVRTPFGKFGGSLKDFKAIELGAIAIEEAVSRAGIDSEMVDYVKLGMVLQAGTGQIPSRQAAIEAGIPPEVPADTINKVCASGLRTVNLGDMMIRLGEADIIVAGGMESMSQAPYAVRGVRWGLKMGNREFEDLMITDGLWCPFADVHMGVHGSQVAEEFDIGREEQDEWSLRSHMRAIDAREAGKFEQEILPVEVPQRRGDPVVFDHDETVRPDTSMEALRSLPPVFEREGTVTAGNAPGLNDGAGALVLMSAEKASELGVEPMATIISRGAVSAEPPYLHTVPYYSVMQALENAGLDSDDLEVLEVNEAFAAVTLTSMKLGEWDPDRVNVNGGAVAIGHPIGASGARILMTLIYELQRRGGGYGLATICSGGGQGEATIVKVD
jgi:acetyl-CoA C-acetyltransferase